MRYRANRGGHAPGHLRGSFEEWVEEAELENATLEDKVEVGSEVRTLGWLLGQLWNCTDIMPGDMCDLLDMSCGSTYAQAVRGLKLDLNA